MCAEMEEVAGMGWGCRANRDWKMPTNILHSVRNSNEQTLTLCKFLGWSLVLTDFERFTSFHLCRNWTSIVLHAAIREATTVTSKGRTTKPPMSVPASGHTGHI